MTVKLRISKDGRGYFLVEEGKMQWGEYVYEVLNRFSSLESAEKSYARQCAIYKEKLLDSQRITIKEMEI